MTNITIYRGATKDATGAPVLEAITYAPAEDGEGVTVPGHSGRWRFVSGSNMFVDLPVTPPTFDLFGKMIDIGGVDTDGDLYALPVRAGLTLLDIDDFIAAWNAWALTDDAIEPLDPDLAGTIEFAPPRKGDNGGGND